MQDFKYKMKKAGKTVLFLLILTVLLTGISQQMVRILKQDDCLLRDRNKNVIGIQREPENTIDVLILGDSLSITAFSPMRLWKNCGITSYVCGQSGQKIQGALYMLKTALEKQSPKLVILETNTVLRKQKKLKAVERDIEEKGYYYFPVFRFHDIWKLLFKGTKYQDQRYKGALFRDSVKPYKGGDYMKKPGKKKRLSKVSKYYLGIIEELCKEKGIALLLVSSPSPDNYSDRTHCILQEYTRKHSLDYLDMNLKIDEIGIDWNMDSLDKGDHLNLSGAGKVTEYLGDYLQSGYQLPDHRGDLAYAEWEKEAEEYDTRVKEALKKMTNRQKF